MVGTVGIEPTTPSMSPKYQLFNISILQRSARITARIFKWKT